MGRRGVTCSAPYLGRRVADMLSVPIEYQKYVECYGTFEGFTSGEPSYIALWGLAELPGNNADIQIQELAPGFIAFAGNGGGHQGSESNCFQPITI